MVSQTYSTLRMIYTALILMQILTGSAQRHWQDIEVEGPVDDTNTRKAFSLELHPLLFLQGSGFTESPISAPSNEPTNIPSSSPSGSPTDFPSPTPSFPPTNSPRTKLKSTFLPTSSALPSASPTSSPSLLPSSSPSNRPSAPPAPRPTTQPTPQPVSTERPTTTIESLHARTSCEVGELLFELILYGVDGWGGAVIGIIEGLEASRYHFVGTLEAGNAQSYGICLKKQVCYELLVTKGTFPQAIGWEIRWARLGSSLAGDYIARGGAPNECSFSVWDAACPTTCDSGTFPNSIDILPRFKTDEPTKQPTQTPTNEPTIAPSSFPTSSPSSHPSVYSSTHPSTYASSEPTSIESPKLVAPVPTPPLEVEVFIPNPAPANPPAQYFNYDPRTEIDGGGYGPGTKVEFMNKGVPSHRFVSNYWKNLVARRTYESNYWKEYAEYLPQDFTQNYCGETNGKQSPIDIVDTGVDCMEFHEIRHRAGDFRINDTEVETLILPSKLRIKYPNRVGQEPDVPSADIPFGWEKQMDILHIDIKIPSEHTLNGTRYAAEYQIFLLSKKTQRGIPVVSVLIDLHPQDRPNIHFQRALNQFQKVYVDDFNACRKKLDSRRNLQESIVVGEETTAHGAMADKPIKSDNDKKHKRKRRLADPKTSPGRWDPWRRDEIMNSVWFYGYKGSLTEPPCSQNVHWRIVDKPMLISRAQLQLMKRLLFDHVDANCNPTSVQWEGSVARPIQQSSRTSIWHCTCKNFLSDKDRDATGQKTC